MSYNYNNQREAGQSGVLTNISRIFATLGDQLEPEVRDHLKNVYALFSIMLGGALVGGVVYNVFALHSIYFLVPIGIIGLMLAIVFVYAKRSRGTEKTRMCCLIGLAFLIGYLTDPVAVGIVGVEDSSIVFTAYLISCVVFGSFTLVALYAESTKFLHLGGVLTSALFSLAAIGVVSWLSGGGAYINAWLLWTLLGINCGFVLYYTQLIVEKRRRGETDHYGHTVMLFDAFVEIFRDIMLILKGKSDNNRTIKRPF